MFRCSVAIAGCERVTARSLMSSSVSGASRLGTFVGLGASGLVDPIKIPRFYAIEVDSRPGEPEYDRALGGERRGADRKRDRQRGL
jgi:hypothetical protein